MDVNTDLTAYCGVDCSVCADFMEEKCPGCRKTDWQAGNTCLPVMCCRRKGISFCGECPSFPCADMGDFYTESESHKQAYALMLAIRNKDT